MKKGAGKQKRSVTTRPATHDMKAGRYPISEWSSWDHKGASVTSPTMRGFIPWVGDPRTDSIELDVLRRRSYALERSSSIASALIKSIATEVVGAGITVYPRCDWAHLGWSREQGQEWDAQVRREWELFANKQSLDYYGTQTFAQLQYTAYYDSLVGGDCFAMFPMMKRQDGNPYDTRIQLIESALVCNENNGVSTKDMVDGIVLDAAGVPVAYMIRNYFEGSILPGVDPAWRRVGKWTGDTLPRRNMAHIIRKRRPTQIRGLPLISPVLEQIYMLETYLAAETNAAVITSYVTYFITSAGQEGVAMDMGDDEYSPQGDSFTDGSDGTQKSDMYQSQAEFSQGMMFRLKQGDSIEAPRPERPNTAAQLYVYELLKIIGAAVELPIDIFQKNFPASYSASRGAMLLLWKMVKDRRNEFIDNFCKPTYENFMYEAIVKGRIKAPGFFQDPLKRESYLRGYWVGQPRGHIDEGKEIEASVIAIDAGLKARSMAILELTGLNPDQVLDQIEEEQDRDDARAKERGIPIGGRERNERRVGGRGSDPGNTGESGDDEDETGGGSNGD